MEFQSGTRTIYVTENRRQIFQIHIGKRSFILHPKVGQYEEGTIELAQATQPGNGGKSVLRTLGGCACLAIRAIPNTDLEALLPITEEIAARIRREEKFLQSPEGDPNHPAQPAGEQP